MSEHIARISYGKDSLKMLNVIRSRGLPLDRITTTDVWATDTISANLPPMQAFKDRMDQKIWDLYRIEVEHLCARNKDGSKKTYEQMFYHVPIRRSQIGNVERERERERRFPDGSPVGFPVLGHPWCQSELKSRVASPPMEDAGRNHRIPAEHGIQLVPEAQIKDSRRRYLHGAESSRSTRSQPLFRRPCHEGQEKKYRGIPGHCGG